MQIELAVSGTVQKHRHEFPTNRQASIQQAIACQYEGCEHCDRAVWTTRQRVLNERQLGAVSPNGCSGPARVPRCRAEAGIQCCALFTSTRHTMETPNERKERMWQEFQKKSGLGKPSNDFRTLLGVIAVILGALVVAAIFR